MTEWLMNLLNGSSGAVILRILSILFLTLLAAATLATSLAPSVKPGKTSYTLLRATFALSFAALLIHQAFWQLLGYTNPDLVKFMRRYNRRPNAADTQITRGPILDRRGLVLAAPVPGDVWGRRYPLGAATAHPIGYYHSKYGIIDIEKACDPELSGYTVSLRDEPIGKLLLAQRAQEGQPVTLTLDSRLQLLAYEKLAGRKGAAIAIRPATGELLALVSSPGFDPLDPASAFQDNKGLPAFNRAVRGLYPPGSTFKILIAAMALEIQNTPAFDCPGQGYIPASGTRPIRDSEYYAYARRNAAWRGWGRIGLKDGLVHSSNVYFSQLGVHCGHGAFNAFMERALIGQPITYFQSPSGALNSVRSSAPAVRSAPAVAHLAIGQGTLLTTPLYVATVTAAVAAGGNMMRPRLNADTPPERLATLCSPKTASQLRGMLREAVTRGTGKAADIPGLDVCGKTGTAQTGRNTPDHAWFTCFAPRHNPQIAVTVLIEHGGFGAAAALPVARAILEEADRLGHVRPASSAGGRP